MDSLHRSYIEISLARVTSLDITHQIMEDFFAKKDMKVHFKKLRNDISTSFEHSKQYLEKDVLDILIQEATEQEKNEIEQFK